MEASGCHGDAHHALDDAIGHIERRDTKDGRKIIAMIVVMMKSCRVVTVFAAENDEAAAEQQEQVTAPPVLAEMDYEIHLMTVEEAVMVFELQDSQR